MCQLYGVRPCGPRRLADALADAGPEREVYVDLGHVREFNDCGIAVLAQALRESPARVSLRGLRQHQHRMLRYLGVGGRALEENTADSVYKVRDVDELSPFD
jgi:hypothetical protein